MKTLLFSALLLSLPVLAADPAAPPQPSTPKPAPELEALKFLVGTFKCDGKAGGGNTGVPEYAFKSTLKTRPDLNQFWLMTTHEEAKSKANPHGYRTIGHVGYDPSQKLFVRAFAASDGSYEQGTAKGWEDGKMVWTGEVLNQLGQAKLPFRHTFTKVGDTEMLNSFELNMGGQWMTWASERCKKASSR